MSHSLGVALRDASGAAALTAVVGFAAVAVQGMYRRRSNRRHATPRPPSPSVSPIPTTAPRWAMDPADLAGGFLHAEHPHAPTSHRPRRTRIA